MDVTGFPTSCDIYLELDGRKVAVVQSYTAKATKTSQVVEAFGESEPVATINGQNKYVLELTLPEVTGRSRQQPQLFSQPGQTVQRAGRELQVDSDKFPLHAALCYR